MTKLSAPTLDLLTTLKNLDFPINFCFAVENVWITALMISYNTPNIIDSFIWIIPNIVSIIIRPFLRSIILNNRAQSRAAQITVIVMMMFMGIIGCLLVSISVLFFQITTMKIILCTLGWTLTDFGFEMVQYFTDRFSECMIKNARYRQQSLQNDKICNNFEKCMENKNWQMLGTIGGYVISMLICFIYSQKSLKKFQKKSAIIYFVAAIISLIFTIQLWFKTKNMQVPILQKSKRIQVLPSSDIGYYMPGYYQFMMANFKDKMYLFYHFTILYIVDTVLIYTSMWIVYSKEYSGQKQGYSYNEGMLYGSFYLLLYTLFYYFQLDYNHQSKVYLSKILWLGFLSISIVSILFYITFQDYIACILCVLVGIVHSFYENNLQAKYLKQYPVFEVCLEFIERVEKIFILCPMPFIIMIILGRDDIDDCLICLSLFGFVSLLYTAIYNYYHIPKSVKKARKTYKVQ